eukprot:Hpha_TRINITY_DN30415_c0_g1::TRINITY_DN30415_c0_g1_i1::g.167969::m.167969
MIAKGKTLGVNFDFGVEVGNSFDSHRVVYWALTKSESEQDKLCTELAADHFERKRCVCDWQVLREAAERVGLSGQECEEVLQSGRFGEEVQAELQKAADEGFHSIPQFALSSKPGARPVVIGGAASPEDYEHVLRRVVSLP